MTALKQLKQTSPSFDEAAIRAHCEMLHGLASGINGLLVVSTFFANPAGGKDLPGTVTHHAVGDIDGMVEAIMASDGTANANVYTGLQVMANSLARGKRGKARDIVAVLGLVADRDDDKAMAGEIPVAPNLILETSPGNFQPFILFDRPLSAAETKVLARALKQASGTDHGTADSVHIWRIPGTLNWPNRAKLQRGRSPEPVPVTVSQPWDGTVSPVGDVAAALLPWVTAQKDETAVQLGDLPDIDGIEVSATVAGLLSANDVGDRSAHAARVVERLAFDGHAAEQACALFLSASGDWLGRYGSEDNARTDFERSWAKFGKPHVDERAAATEAGMQLTASLKPKGKLPPVAANDNERGVLQFMGEDRAYIPKPELIRDTVPRTGVGFFGGQSGALKTFFSIHAATCLMTGEALAGREVERPGGVVYLAAEGEGTIEGRMKARRMQMDDPTEILPFFTLTNFGSIDDQGAYVALEGRLKLAAERMERRFNVPLVALIVDTVAAAGMIPEDKENDPGAWQKVFHALQPISERLDIVIILIHHAGKNAAAGLRGSSNARAAADFALMLACDRDEITGDTQNHYLHLAKSRDAPEGPIAAIQKRVVEIAKRDDGSPITTLVLDFDLNGKAPARKTKTSKTDRPFREAFAAAERHNVRVHGERDAPEVQAAKVEDVRAEFALRYVTAQSDAAKRVDAVRTAFRLAVTRARETGDYTTGSWGDAEWIWTSKPQQ